VNVICEHCGRKYEDERETAICPHKSFAEMDVKLERAHGVPIFTELTDEQRLELSHDLFRNVE
jgi:hypothetical protein